MGKVTISADVVKRLNNLIDILLEKEYFSFEENAIEYVNKIESFILNLPNQQHKICKINKYGKFYAKYKPNKRTSWYVIFNKQKNLYLVKYITNNHTEEYATIVKE